MRYFKYESVVIVFIYIFLLLTVPFIYCLLMPGISCNLNKAYHQADPLVDRGYCLLGLQPRI